MRKDFYLFRHGETDYNKDLRWQGCGIDMPLNATGISQAEALSERLKPLGLEIIYSSPLKRALETAQIVATQLKLKVKIIPDLREGNLGICKKKKKQDIANKYPDLWRKWYDDEIDLSVRWPEGESKLEMQQRMFKAFEKMLSTKEDIIGVSSHSGAMRYFLLAFGYGPHKMPNTALFHLIFEDGKWHLNQN